MNEKYGGAHLVRILDTSKMEQEKNFVDQFLFLGRSVD